MLRYLTLLLLCFVTLSHADDLAPIETRKINYLITAIESLPDAQFIRNNTAYDAKSAADHLRLKWKNTRAKVVTAEDFIRLCGSVSSMSGKPYQIRYTDGRIMTSAVFLRARLAKYVDKPMPNS